MAPFASKTFEELEEKFLNDAPVKVVMEPLCVNCSE